jgi:hypothetical protein
MKNTFRRMSEGSYDLESARVKSHRSEMLKMKENLEEVNENFEVKRQSVK